MYTHKLLLTRFLLKSYAIVDLPAPSNLHTCTCFAGGEAYVDSQPSWGGILNNSSSGGGGSSAGGKDDSSGSPITRLLAAAKDHVRAAPLPGAASPWLALALVPVVLWCLGW